MSNALQSYDVVVPPELALKWKALSSSVHTRLSERLALAAKTASRHATAWPAGPAGAHRGKHRALVDELWLLYRQNDETRTVSLMGFGRVDGAQVEN